jgi:acyl-CoA synthetase (AMP-forming)/AMP-acid ligase II
MNTVERVAAQADSDALAYVFLADGTPASEQRWSFADTARRARAYAAALRERGIAPGDRVVLAVAPSLEYVGALYGIMWAGAVPVPCFPPLRAKEMDRFAAITVDCAPAAIVIDEMFGGAVADLHDLIVYPEHVENDSETTGPAPSLPSDIALVQYTSGSTGSPKGVCLTHANLVSNCEALQRNMGVDPDRVGFSWLPPYHDMGLMGTILISMHQGVTLVMMSPLHFVQSPRRWLEAISHYRVTITVGPNFSLDMCAEVLEGGPNDDLDLSTVERLYCGAEPISVETLQRFENAVTPVGFDLDALVPCYGMAEATLYVAGKAPGRDYHTSPDPGTPAKDVVSCGVVDAEHTVRIVDAATCAALPDGTVGEIWVAGPSVAAGYHDRNDLTHTVFGARIAGQLGAYLRTGDLGFLRDGELFVTGRIKDLVIVNGRNIYPQDVEANVTGVDAGIRLAVAFSIPGADTERLCVVVEAQDGTAALADAIRASVTAEFGVRPHVYIAPKRTIPTTTSGKVRRQETRRMFLAGELECTA